MLQGCSSPLPIKQKLKLPITYAPAAVKNTISQCVRSSCKKQSPFSVWVIRSKYLNCKCLLYKLTWPLRIAPEICGAKNPIMFPTELVIPIKVPANLGAISSWLQVTALKLKPLMPKVAQSKTTTRYRWQPTKWSIHKQIAGGINAENVFLYQNVIEFWKIYMSWSPHYFTNSYSPLTPDRPQVKRPPPSLQIT